MCVLMASLYSILPIFGVPFCTQPTAVRVLMGALAMMLLVSSSDESHVIHSVIVPIKHTPSYLRQPQWPVRLLLLTSIVAIIVIAVVRWWRFEG